MTLKYASIIAGAVIGLVYAFVAVSLFLVHTAKAAPPLPSGVMPNNLQVFTSYTNDSGDVAFTDAGCVLYGSLVATIHQSHDHGVPASHFDELVEKAPDKNLPGGEEFIRTLVASIYKLPKDTSTNYKDYARFQRTAIDRCREAGGVLWRLI